jgi:hypothetical protein
VEILFSHLVEPSFQDVIVELIGPGFVGPQQTYFRTFAHAMGSDKAQLTKSLAMVGLWSKDDAIQTGNCNRWNEMSMVSRIELRMPPITNSLECTHRRFNEATPRRITFCGSLSRIGAAIVDKAVKVRSRLSHNCERALQTSQRVGDAAVVRPEQLQRERVFYETSPTNSQCREIRRQFAMCWLIVPSAHLFQWELIGRRSEITLRFLCHQI